MASWYIAQWLERLTADQQVPGSNPGVPSFPYVRFKKNEEEGEKRSKKKKKKNGGKGGGGGVERVRYWWAWAWPGFKFWENLGQKNWGNHEI